MTVLTICHCGCTENIAKTGGLTPPNVAALNQVVNQLYLAVGLPPTFNIGRRRLLEGDQEGDSVRDAKYIAPGDEDNFFQRDNFYEREIPVETPPEESPAAGSVTELAPPEGFCYTLAPNENKFEPVLTDCVVSVLGNGDAGDCCRVCSETANCTGYSYISGGRWKVSPPQAS